MKPRFNTSASFLTVWTATSHRYSQCPGCQTRTIAPFGETWSMYLPGIQTCCATYSGLATTGVETTVGGVTTIGAGVIAPDTTPPKTPPTNPGQKLQPPRPQTPWCMGGGGGLCPQPNPPCGPQCGLANAEQMHINTATAIVIFLVISVPPFNLSFL